MEKINREKTIEKWEKLIGNMGLSDDRKSWLSNYAQKSFDCEVDSPIHNGGSGTQSSSESFSILPMAMRVAAKTIAQDLVSVQPIDGVNMDEIMSDIKTENRDRAIDSIIEDKEFEPMKPQDHPDYNGPK
jgi:hypothetical protein